MRILFVGMPDSVHTARWINQVSDLGWDLYLFSASPGIPHTDLRNITVYNTSLSRPQGLNKSVRVRGLWPMRIGVERLSLKISYSTWLARLIRWLRPDIVHSLEIQQAGYLTQAARAKLGLGFPPWIVSSWGSDIFLYGRLSGHVERIKAVLASCDYFCCDCRRDIPLARSLGLRGITVPVFPVAGGLDTEQLKRLRSPGPSSARRVIALKGYQNWAGRALVGLRAIELCADALIDYRVVVYLASLEVELASELLSYSTGIATEIVPPSPHDEVLQVLGRARISIGLSISDGLPLSSLEAMGMGAFPIQSDTSCLGEWLRDGESALLVNAEDPEGVAAAIRRAVSDDELVDRAAEINARMILESFDSSVIQPKVIEMYQSIVDRTRVEVQEPKQK